ncbi:MAG: hypothetical protein G01um101466_95 [Parcubacteria group bacterium Gr01-1014_66]|nr:MAG: hypothetical protein G01um101466_95 [Parcubacteria group bacterium Gr01-1014_66]
MYMQTFQNWYVVCRDMKAVGGDWFYGIEFSQNASLKRFLLLRYQGAVEMKIN